MALRIAVSQEDLTMTTFALSPLWELNRALRALAGDPAQRDEPVLRPWLAQARDRYQALASETDIGLILALHPPGWGVDFLTPVPAGLSTTIADPLDSAGNLRGSGASRDSRGAAAAAAGRPQNRADPG
jgi:hypothetical protein